jgi:hypothetical protein
LLSSHSKYSAALVNCQQIFDNCQSYLNEHYPHEITIQTIKSMMNHTDSIYIDQKPQLTSQVVFVNAAARDHTWKTRVLDFLSEYFAIHVSEFVYNLPKSVHYNSRIFELFEQNVIEMNRQTPAFYLSLEFKNSKESVMHVIGTKTSLYRKLSDLSELLVYLTNGEAFVYEIEPKSLLSSSLAKLKTIRSKFESDLEREKLGSVSENANGSFEIRHKPSKWTESRRGWTGAVKKLVRLYEEKFLLKIERNLVREFDFLSDRSEEFREMCADFQYFVQRKYQDWKCVDRNGLFTIEFVQNKLVLLGDKKRAELFNERVIQPEIRRVKHSPKVDFCELRYDCRLFFKENKIVSFSNGE